MQIDSPRPPAARAASPAVTFASPAGEKPRKKARFMTSPHESDAGEPSVPYHRRGRDTQALHNEIACLRSELTSTRSELVTMRSEFNTTLNAILARLNVQPAPFAAPAPVVPQAPVAATGPVRRLDFQGALPPRKPVAEAARRDVAPPGQPVIAPSPQTAVAPSMQPSVAPSAVAPADQSAIAPSPQPADASVDGPIPDAAPAGTGANLPSERVREARVLLGLYVLAWLANAPGGFAALLPRQMTRDCIKWVANQLSTFPDATSARAGLASKWTLDNSDLQLAWFVNSPTKSNLGILRETFSVVFNKRLSENEWVHDSKVVVEVAECFRDALTAYKFADGESVLAACIAIANRAAVAKNRALSRGV